jgi:hypothetical protein
MAASAPFPAVPRQCLAGRWSQTPQCQWLLGKVSPVFSSQQSGWNEGVWLMTQTAPSFFSGPGPSFQAVSACSILGSDRGFRTASIPPRLGPLSRAACLQSLMKCPAFPHRQHTGRLLRRHSGGVGGLPVGTLVTYRSNLTVGQAAAFAASSLSAWFRASFTCLPSPIRRFCFIYLSRTPSMNAKATSVSMCSTGSPTKARRANFSMATANSCSVSPFWPLIAIGRPQPVGGLHNCLSEPRRCPRK